MHCDYLDQRRVRGGEDDAGAELVVATAVSLRRHHADTLIVPMTPIRDAYRAEILGGLAGAGEEVLLAADRLTPAELADEVLTAAGLRQVH
jgi:hypothetical protein